MEPEPDQAGAGAGVQTDSGQEWRAYSAAEELRKQEANRVWIRRRLNRATCKKPRGSVCRTLVAAGALGEQEGRRGRQVGRRHQNQLLHGVERGQLLEAQGQGRQSVPGRPARTQLTP